MLQLYNSLTRTKERFKPIGNVLVKMYVCGQTVYDYSHIGHARSMINFDVLHRYLRFLGYKVTYVRNITDIDDKIINRCLSENVSLTELTDFYIKAMQDDADKLNVLPPTYEPRVTEYIPQIQNFINGLLVKGHAYIGENGDVLFSIQSFKNYGKLSNKNLENPKDFVLWKLTKAGEPSWDSQWGKGRPGWHIECSTMAHTLLGDTFDIHGGGLDLQFPHHENEIAQSQSFTGKPPANYWLHNGLVQIDDLKIGNSNGNRIKISDITKRFNLDLEALRLYILQTHYRSPLKFDIKGLDDAAKALTRLYSAFENVPDIPFQDITSNHTKRFLDALDDDLNTPIALSVLFDLVHEINVLKSNDDHQHAEGIVLINFNYK